MLAWIGQYAVGTQAGGGWFPEILGGPQTASSSLPEGEGKERPYLPDYSYAGYHWGEDPLPDPTGTVIRVVDYGAVPDDGQDDTAAVLKALEVAHGTPGSVIVRFPSGRFILSQVLLIERSHLVLQGAGDGPDGTVLHFLRPLTKMKTPPGDWPVPPSGDSFFSFGGGMVWTRAPANPEHLIAELTAGERGQHHLELKAEAPPLQPGDVVRISWYNRGGSNGSLLRHVFGTLEVPIKKRVYKKRNRPLVTQDVTVTIVQGRSVTIKEPLLHDLREAWTPTLTTVSFLEEVGIEHLRINFPETTYEGHHQEAGYNGLYLSGLLHSWVHDVTVVNGDSGMLIRYCKNATLRDIHVLGRGGHYTVMLTMSYGVLVEEFDLRAPAIHNPSIATRTAHCVYARGQIYAPRIDQHSGINHQNLFDDISVYHYREAGVFFDRSGGGGAAAGAFNTFWNLRISDPKGTSMLGEVRRAPYARLVGVRGERLISFSYGPHAYIEGTNRSGIAVPSLYTYQLKQRLCTAATPSIALIAPSNGTAIPEGKAVTINAAIFGGREAVEKVVFFVNGKKVATDKDGSDGWNRTWSASRPGTFQISAVAKGGATQSVAVNCRRAAVKVWVGPPSLFVLKPNYPNPFQRQTTIPYMLRREVHVRLEIYDILGRRVAMPVDEVQEEGQHRVRFGAHGLSSGVYFYRLVVGSSAKVEKMVVLR